MTSGFLGSWIRRESSTKQGGLRLGIRSRPSLLYGGARSYHDLSNERARLSRFWIPTGGIASNSGQATEDANALLIRAGYIRQAHAGIYHILPLGLRVHEKLERLIGLYMEQIGASKLALPSISSEDLWKRSGRLSEGPGELFRFHDRKKGAYLLSPTHEEEVTSIVASTVKSYRDCPLRLYQISRKFRDELRPRQGLLRSREFVMKDLYTFDYSYNEAMETYKTVKDIYVQFFDRFKLPYLVANADSGNMGGDISHEFHLPAPNGEDTVITCNSCGYSANEEVVQSRIQDPVSTAPTLWTFQNEPINFRDPELDLEKAKNSDSQHDDPLTTNISVYTAISRDKLSLVNVFYPSKTRGKRKASSGTHQSNDINTHRIRNLVPEVDTGVETPLDIWKAHFKPYLSMPANTDSTPNVSSQIINIFDYRIPSNFYTSTFSSHADIPVSSRLSTYFSKTIPTTSISQDPTTDGPLDVLQIKNDDPCPRCSEGSLRLRKAVELGHTFFLGTQYSAPLNALVTGPDPDASVEAKLSATKSEKARPLEMGCHGIGISRTIAAVAGVLSDDKGLNWPRVIAPFEAIVIPGRDLTDAACEVYDALASRPNGVASDENLDLVLDDREKSMTWKMKDADLVGVPVIVIVGRAWKEDRQCEVQCRRLGTNLRVPLSDVRETVLSLLSKL